MRLRDAVNLQVGDVISCGACKCDGSEVEINARHRSSSGCGCVYISHEGRSWCLVVDRRKCTSEHHSNSCWGVLVDARKVKLIRKKGAKP